MQADAPKTVEEYIAGFPQDIQIILKEMRNIIRQAAPEAEEKISWGMATYVLNGNLVHFSGQKKHLGFHPSPSGVEIYRSELEGYRYSKGTIQFPYDKPLPEELIKKIVKFRVTEQKHVRD